MSAAAPTSFKRSAASAGLPLDAVPPLPPPPPPPRLSPPRDPQPAVGRFVYPPPCTDYADLPAMLGHPDLGPFILGWLGDDTVAASALRGTCVAARDAVAGYAWADATTRIAWPGRWRRAFPRAVAANVSSNQRLRDADFVHLRGLRELDMSFCRLAAITDAAFAHLTGIHTLYMDGCNQATITDAAFAHLRGIYALHMNNCIQLTITDAAFEHLTGIHTLVMDGCNQATITDAAFAHLRGIHTLRMIWCTQATITAGFRARLRQAGIPALYM